MTKCTKNASMKGLCISVAESFSSLDERFQEMKVKAKNQ